MILTLDIGNTQSVFGVWDKKQLVDKARVSTNTWKTEDEWYWIFCQFFGKTKLIKVALYSSVVPSQNTLVERGLHKFGIDDIYCLSVDDSPFKFNYLGKKTLGADRISNVIGALRFYGENIVIVDFGTAITFCSVEAGIYQDSVIIPGINTALDSLFKKTAKLPKVDLPKKIEDLGKDTVSSIEAGIYLSYRGMIREILYEITEKQLKKPLIIGTGGITESLVFIEDFFDIIDENLLLKGLLSFYELIN